MYNLTLGGNMTTLSQFGVYANTVTSGLFAPLLLVLTFLIITGIGLKANYSFKEIIPYSLLTTFIGTVMFAAMGWIDPVIITISLILFLFAGILYFFMEHD